MKKILAILLSIICLFGAFSMPASAGNTIGDAVEDYLGLVPKEDDIDDKMAYGIHYEMQPLAIQSIMYKPNPTLTFQTSVYTKVTTDTPISIDYNFVYWKEAETGKIYYPGDDILVTGKVVLYAVWEEKTDNFPRFIRVIISAFQTLNRLVQQFLGIFQAVDKFESEYYATTTLPANVE